MQLVGSPERELIVSLVHTVAGGTEPSPEAVQSADPVTLMRTLEHLRAVPVLAPPLVARHGDLLPAWFRDRVATTRQVSQRAGLLHHALTDKLAAALAERNVPTMPLKGVTLAETVHGDLGARVSHDIDLLVEPEHLDAATATLRGLGWWENTFTAPRRGLPLLHRVLHHEAHPPVELHWRVHWYENSYSTEALRRALLTADGWLRAQPRDELAFLLLFLARDGFAGWRQIVDVAAWWRSVGATRPTGHELRQVAAALPRWHRRWRPQPRWPSSWSAAARQPAGPDAAFELHPSGWRCGWPTPGWRARPSR